LACRPDFLFGRNAIEDQKVHELICLVSVRVRWRRNDTATWVLPIHVPGDRQKTVNLIKSAAYRVPIQGYSRIRASEVFLKIAGAAQAHGIKVPASRAASTYTGPAVYVPSQSNRWMLKREEKAARAEAELHRERLIKQIGNWWE